jgi:hypothetical protein
MSNEYYDHGTYPQTGAQGSSASLRAELESIEAGFNKLPVLTANANKLVKINSTADGLEDSDVYSDDGTNATVSGDLFVTGGQIGQNAAQKHTIPVIASDTFALLAAAQTFTNKVISAALNTITTAASGNLTSTNLNAALAELQTDIDNRQPLDADLTALAALATAADRLPYFTGAATASLATFTAFARTLLDDANAATARLTLGSAASGSNSDITELTGITGLVDISSATAGQIKFPATQNASANANTLDDYEEGTFTPTITASSGAFTTVSGTGFYTKVGRVITLQGEVTITTVGTASGSILVAGLPFAILDRVVGVSRERVNTGFLGSFQAASTSATILRYDNASLIGAGNVITYTHTCLT